MTTLYVGNLSWDTDNDSLAKFFEGLDVRSAEVQLFREGTRSKGWGLVTFGNDADAREAIESYNNKELDGRSVIVREDRGPRVREGGAKDSKEADEEYSQSKLFVGNLSWDTTSDDLFSHFSKFGRVVNAEIQTRFDGRSRGWGVVEMSSEDEARTAIDNMDGAVIDERNIKVEIMKPRGTVAAAPRRQRSNNRARRAPREEKNDADAAPSNSLYVGNLPWSCDDSQLADLFKGFGATEAHIKVGYNDRSRGYGIVSFATVEDAARAINGVNGVDCEGRTVQVRFDRGN